MDRVPLGAATSTGIILSLKSHFVIQPQTEMSLNRRFIQYLTCIIFIILAFPAYSQPPINQQIPADMLPSQIDPKQLSQSQLSSLLNDKNRENVGKDKNAGLSKNNVRLDRDTINKDNLKNIYNTTEMTYGANVFQRSAVNNLDELSTPPLDYPIGVGDNITVALWGAAEFQETYVVARDGSIFPQGLGKINVQGLTFENVRSVINSRFRGVVPGGTNISVSLGQPRSININVVGEVNNAGPVTVSAFSNAFHVIAIAGGVTELGNLRSIKIKRNGRVIDELDVYKYLSSGDFGKHIYLQNNDFIIVGVVEKKVMATGQFRRPMFYQLKKEEGVKALLFYTGGLKPEALASAMKVMRTENEKQVQRDVNANAILKMTQQDFMLEDGDVVRVDIIKTGISNKVELRGEVTYPNFYELRQGDRLFDVINRAGGVTKNTFLQRAYIFRGAGDSTNLQSERLEINLSDISNTSSINNVQLQPNDVIQLFAQSDFTDAQYVEISGEIRREGRIRKYGGMTLQDLLFLSGGIKPSAEFGRLEISSIVDIDSAMKGLKPTRTIVRAFSILPNLKLDSMAATVLLRPFDQVFVRKNPTFELQQNIELQGLVKYPGKYPRLDQYERLSSYITRAGGLKENANISGAVLFRKRNEFLREKIVERPKLDSTGMPIFDSLPNTLKQLDEPVSIDLYSAMKNKNSKHDIILQEDDVVFVPEINPFISVQGSVQSPVKIAFDKEHKSLSYYIDKAGGFSTRPWRRRIFVTYANGRSKRTKNFLFFHFYPKVEEGSIVTVPLRPQGQEMADFGKNILVAAVPVVITGLIFKYIK